MIFPKNKADFRILLVEDELRTVRGTMRGIGLRVSRIDNARSIKEAVSFIKENNYDLLIVDVRLPNTLGGKLITESGLDFILKLQEGTYGNENIQTPFMILTAQNRSLRLNSIENNSQCIGVYGKLSHLDVMKKIDSLLDKEDGRYE